MMMKLNVFAALKIIGLTVVFSWLMCWILISFYRFPVPLAGYIGPHEGNAYDIVGSLNQSFMGIFFYGFVFGGIPIALIVSFSLNHVLSELIDSSKRLYVSALLASAFWTVILSNLDYIIGPW
ncbi:hypothetical protein [Alteromonas sp. a30]|uniref:hypothetical protein n=1 Tax=Alteromonas sp. a30 TaxID=2730917 RepID=UPI0022803FAA|nr:hypothetical protein [Alteromonas sp. a30]MCY7293816.1 hypothetical protein [Alteromonas sp. a30]